MVLRVGSKEVEPQYPVPPNIVPNKIPIPTKKREPLRPSLPFKSLIGNPNPPNS